MGAYGGRFHRKKLNCGVKENKIMMFDSKVLD